MCDRCYPKIPSRQCPQCRSNYMGTRNYILEEMIKTLKMLKSGAAGESDAKKEKKASKSAEAKLTDEIAKLVNMIPSVEEVVPEPTALIEIREGPSAIELLRMAAQAEPEDDDGEAEINALSDSIRDLPSRPAHAVAQPGGLFNCRMLGCNERVPVCRMLPHIRSLHADHLAHQAAVNNDFVTQFSFPYATYRRALHIPRFGLFFLIVNVKRENVFNQITAWVQVVGRREQCRHFSYELNLRVGNRIATYKDFVSTTSHFNHFSARFAHSRWCISDVWRLVGYRHNSRAGRMSFATYESSEYHTLQGNRSYAFHQQNDVSKLCSALVGNQNSGKFFQIVY